MSAVRSQKRNIGISEDEPPEKKIVSDGDILIKQLHEKQTNTTITLQEQLSKTKEFQTASEFVPITSYVSGTKNLKEFEEILANTNYTETLQAAGLSNEDIHLFRDYIKNEEGFFKKHKNYESSALVKRIVDIKRVLADYETQLSNRLNNEVGESSTSGRHKTEFGLSVKPNSIETKLLKFALNSTKHTSSNIPHPMDDIKQIEHECFAHLSNSALPINKIRKKARNLANKIQLAEKGPVLPTNCPKPQNNSSLVSSSKWDSQECDAEVETIKTVKHYTCKPQNFYTIKNGEIVKLKNDHGNASHKFEEEAVKQVGLEELKCDPKFRDYQEGTPSKILYLKNLHKKISKEEVEFLFKEFGKEHYTVQLLTGKMSGQAFVTFPSEELATEALRKKNGTILRNRPVVIQFGKKKS